MVMIRKVILIFLITHYFKHNNRKRRVNELDDNYEYFPQKLNENITRN